MKWISVKDILPDDYERVLICAESTSICGNKVVFVGSCKNGFWFIQNSEASLGFPNLQYNVTHWQPLPQPPKEDK